MDQITLPVFSVLHLPDCCTAAVFAELRVSKDSNYWKSEYLGNINNGNSEIIIMRCNSVHT